MNFCMESDEYISLYIDDLLNEEQKEEFLKHINECSECAQKFEEASFIAQLCRESDDIELPVEFSSSLHKRLVDLDAQEDKNRKKLLILNKKLIAGLSTAAVLVISLLAYNLLPQVGIKRDEASMAASERVTSQSSPDALGDTESKNNEQADIYNGSAESAAENGGNSYTKSAEPSIQITSEANADIMIGSSSKSELQSDSKSTESAANDSQLAMTFGAKQSAEEKRTTQSVADEINESDFKLAGGNEESVFTIMGTEKKYYSNTAELILNVATQRIEIDVFKKFMIEIGAVVIPFNKDLNLANQEFFDYNVPLAQYFQLVHRAVNEYDLKLSIKTDIIQTDITSEYNDLSTQKSKIDIQIEETKLKGEDTSLLELRQIELSEKINNILMKNNMISVRIFIYR